nr:toprim domain-containing protein [Brevibacterium sp. 68QC2CO]
MLGVVGSDDREYGDKAGWLTIPYITVTGIVDIRFRRPPESESKAKYKSLPGSTPRLFNATATLNPSDTIFVAEGEGDAMVLAQCGLNAVGVPGASNWSRKFALTLAGFKDVCICRDNDAAGEKLAGNIAKDIEASRTVVFDEKDVTDFYLAHGREALLEKLKPEEDEGDDDYDEYGYAEEADTQAEDFDWEPVEGFEGDAEDQGPQ